MAVDERDRTPTYHDGLPSCVIEGEHGSIGSDLLNSMVIEDSTMSRFHCEINVDQPTVLAAQIDHPRALGLRFEIVAEGGRVSVPQVSRFGSLVGAGKTMRATLALLARARAGAHG